MKPAYSLTHRLYSAKQHRLNTTPSPTVNAGIDPLQWILLHCNFSSFLTINIVSLVRRVWYSIAEGMRRPTESRAEEPVADSGNRAESRQKEKIASRRKRILACF
ncbi:hypothetical protein VFPPC_18071 [Pochonia chlamydosporia 170]|uniref:Uncharacterized protein n=1 Tax=Pochonia chlamydosporia 170 TaxID=1380566 RepID=A0A219APA4_METCM|nr:hypothetical protein VFPPC_18071 [Pochonia chlamydosporia 170]OWT42658.1 hypothetical protein VFPPC_18071 [Pochonia chlamydosporia 170]